MLKVTWDSKWQLSFVFVFVFGLWWKCSFFYFSRMGMPFLYVLVLVYQDGNYMSIPHIWSSASWMRVCILFCFYVFMRSKPDCPTFPGPRQAPLKPSISWKAIIQSNQDLQTQLQLYLNQRWCSSWAVSMEYLLYMFWKPFWARLGLVKRSAHRH